MSVISIPVAIFPARVVSYRGGVDRHSSGVGSRVRLMAAHRCSVDVDMFPTGLHTYLPSVQLKSLEILAKFSHVGQEAGVVLPQKKTQGGTAGTVVCSNLQEVSEGLAQQTSMQIGKEGRRKMDGPASLLLSAEAQENVHCQLSTLYSDQGVS